MNALYQVVAMIGGGLLVGFALGANWKEREYRVTHVALEKTIRELENSTSALADRCAALETLSDPRMTTQPDPSQSGKPA